MRPVPEQPDAGVPSYVEARIRRAPPDGSYVVAGSTPVVSFGNSRTARVATLGLNPSRVEFLDASDRLMTGSDRRLATLESLNVADLATAPAATIARVYRDCVDYFTRRPYRRWFDRLLPMLAATGTSYDDGTACHLDLVQWATDPVWGALPPAARSTLLADDAAFLERQLTHERIDMLLINGTGAWRLFRNAFGERLTFSSAGRVGLAERQPAEMFVGIVFDRVRVIAWSTNLQSSFGVTTSLRQEIARHVGRCARP